MRVGKGEWHFSAGRGLHRVARLPLSFRDGGSSLVARIILKNLPPQSHTRAVGSALFLERWTRGCARAGGVVTQSASPGDSGISPSLLMAHTSASADGSAGATMLPLPPASPSVSAADAAAFPNSRLAWLRNAWPWAMCCCVC